jgi:hypothetical protein
MLQDPPVNFAISTRGHTPGIDHLGIQVDNAGDLAELKARAQAADMVMLDEGATTCCYAKSEKHWVTDPQGIAWEQFHTLANIPVFREGEDSGACCTPAAPATTEPAACCAPAPRGKPIGIPVKSSGGCC